MLFIILSILDLVGAAIMVLGHYQIIAIPVAMAGIYLCLKLIFWRDVFTILDACAGVYLGFVAFGHSGFLTWVFLVYFLYKGATGALFTMST